MGRAKVKLNRDAADNSHAAAFTLLGSRARLGYCGAARTPLDDVRLAAILTERSVNDLDTGMDKAD